MVRLWLVLTLCLWTMPAFAQMAVETSPGVVWFGDALSVETTPGVRFFSGAVSGSAIQLTPGVTSYALQPRSFYRELEQIVVDDGARLNERTRDELEFNQRQRKQMDEFLNRLSRR